VAALATEVVFSLALARPLLADLRARRLSWRWRAARAEEFTGRPHLGLWSEGVFFPIDEAPGVTSRQAAE
jgi:hypothetical protein